MQLSAHERRRVTTNQPERHRAYGRVLPGYRRAPASTLVEIARTVVDGCEVEIEAMAMIPTPKERSKDGK